MAVPSPEIAPTGYAEAFARAPIGMALVGLDSRFHDVNDAFCHIVARPRDELIGHRFEGITHPDDVDGDLALAIQVVRGDRELFAREKRYVRPDGTTCWVDVTGSLIRDAHGNPVHFAFHVQDITERRAAAEQLSLSEARFRSAFEDALTGMALTDPDGRVKRINRVACELLGRSTDELIGVSVAEFTHPDDAAQDRIRMNEIKSGQTDGCRWEKRYLRPSGQAVWADVSTVLVRDADGSPRHFVTQIADITERKRLEQAKEEFLASISHELRTPLTSIQGYADLLLEEGDLRDSFERKSVEAIQRNSQRLSRLVDDVQFIAQARASILSLRRIEVDLHRVVGKSIEWAVPRAGELGLDLAVTTEPVWVRDADAERIGQALDHLVSNALNYTPAGGRVDVRLARDGDHALIEVADTGVGLSAQDAAQLFDRFFRASSAVEDAVPGVGLGLSVVKAIVDLHGGRVDVTTAAGAGTTVHVRLPLEAVRGARPAVADVTS